MKVAARLDRLESRSNGTPANVRECERFLTALIAFGQRREDVTPDMAARIRDEARYYAPRGTAAMMGEIARSLNGRGIGCD